VGLVIATSAVAAGLCTSTAFAAVTLSGSATPTAPLGDSITDAATLSGLVPAGAGGTMLFNAYGPNDPTCAASVFHNEVPADDNGTYYPSVPFTAPSVGTYYWDLTWSGNDTNPGSVSRPCDPLNPSQTSIITPAPSSSNSSGTISPVIPTAPCAGLTGKALKKCLCRQKKGKARKKCLRRLKGRKP
jgi:hypothetical protein